jgi:hypothetical protein
VSPGLTYQTSAISLVMTPIRSRGSLPRTPSGLKSWDARCGRSLGARYTHTSLGWATNLGPGRGSARETADEPGGDPDPVRHLTRKPGGLMPRARARAVRPGDGNALYLVSGDRHGRRGPVRGPSHPCKRCNQRYRRHDSVVSVQLARSVHEAVLLIIRRSWVRAPPAPLYRT